MWEAHRGRVGLADVGQGPADRPTHGSHHGGAGDQADAGHGEQCLAGGTVLCHFTQVLLELPDARVTLSWSDGAGAMKVK